MGIFLMIQLPFPQFLPKSDWKAPRLSDLPDLSQAKEICIDLETYDPELLTRGPGGVRKKGFVCGYAIGVVGFKTYLPVRHSSGNLPFENVQRWVSDQVTRPSQPKVTANGSYDRDWCEADGIKFNGVVYDIQIAECLLNEEQDSYSLDAIAFRHLGEGKDEKLLDEAAKWWSDTESAKKIMHLLSASHVGPYAMGDVDRTLRVFEKQKVKLLEQGLNPIFQMESELSEVVHLMRQQGIRIDLDATERLAKEYRKKEIELYARLKERFFKGRAIDFNSGKDLARVCQDNGFKDYPQTAKGNPSFIGDWMDLQTEATCGRLSELFQGISEYRTIEKIRRDYLEGHFLGCHYRGRIHAEFHQMHRDEGGTRSGRFSVSNPPMQGVPKRSKQAKAVRTLFLPNDGEEFLKHDYSQQEYRIFVSLAMRMGLEGAKEAGQTYISNPEADFHQAIAEMTGLPRDDAKNWNFAAIYGAGVEKTAKMTRKTIEEATKVNLQYHEKVPYAKQLSKDASARAASRGWIKTIGGRILHFETYEPAYFDDNIYVNNEMTKDAKKSGFRFRPLPYALAVKKWPNQRLKRAQCHKALNRYVQGSAADMTKIAMLQLYKQYGYVPLMQVHDELLNSGDKKKGLDIKEIMETAVKLLVPVYADFGIGKNWGETTKVK